jgi:hydrogenase nickel incorporation protein HypA/HybF
MHEMSIAESLFEIVMDTIKKEDQVTKVEAVDLRIGKLRAVIPENLVFCFEVICRGTEVEGAELRIEEVPVRVSCGECREETEKTDLWIAETGTFVRERTRNQRYRGYGIDS